PALLVSFPTRRSSIFVDQGFDDGAHVSVRQPLGQRGRGGGGRQHGAAGVAIKEAFVERERHRDGVAVDGAVVGGGHRGTGAGDGECGGGAEDGGGAGEGAGRRHAGPLSEGQRGGAPEDIKRSSRYVMALCKTRLTAPT